MKKISIPQITDEELIKRYKNIKPIVEFNGIKHWLREFTLTELRNVAYTWNVEESKAKAVDKQVFNMLYTGDFQCFHRYGYPGLFKPSIAEVLSQIPKALVDKTWAFEIIDYPKSGEDLDRNSNALQQGFHTSTVRLYFLEKNYT